MANMRAFAACRTGKAADRRVWRAPKRGVGSLVWCFSCSAHSILAVAAKNISLPSSACPLALRQGAVISRLRKRAPETCAVLLPPAVNLLRVNTQSAGQALWQQPPPSEWHTQHAETHAPVALLFVGRAGGVRLLEADPAVTLKAFSGMEWVAVGCPAAGQLPA